MCVNFEFNVPWFFEGFTEIQKLQVEATEGPSSDVINQQEAEIRSLSKKLKTKQAALQSAKEVFSKKSKPLLNDFP